MLALGPSCELPPESVSSSLHFGTAKEVSKNRLQLKMNEHRSASREEKFTWRGHGFWVHRPEIDSCSKFQRLWIGCSLIFSRCCHRPDPSYTCKDNPTITKQEELPKRKRKGKKQNPNLLSLFVGGARSCSSAAA